MALLNAAKQQAALVNYAAWLESPAGDPYRSVAMHSNKAAIKAAIAAMDTALEAALPTVRQAADPGINAAVKNRLLRFMVEQAING